MTRTFKPTGSELVEQPRMERPFRPKFNDSREFSLACAAYDMHLLSLTRYTITPSDWTGIQEVKEGEFEVRTQGFTNEDEWIDVRDTIYNALPDKKRRLFAIPKRKEQGQEEIIKGAAEFLEKNALTLDSWADNAACVIDYIQQHYTLTKK